MNDIQQVGLQSNLQYVRVNENFKTLRAAATFGIDYANTAGLTLGIKGGPISNDGVATDVADVQIALTGSATNYVERTPAGAVSKNTTGFSADKLRLYKVTTNATGITAIEDHRNLAEPPPGVLSLSVAGGAGDTTLTADQARADVIICTGALTGNRGLVLPQLKRPWIIVNSTTGAFTLTAKTASGAGVAVAQGSNSGVFWDGTNMVAIAAAGAAAAVELKGLTFTSDTDSVADSDPGNGLFKWNNATQASATVLYFDNQTADGVSLTTFWASLAAAGFIYLQQADDSTKWQLWKWTATPVDGTGYRKFTVTLQASAGSIADAKTVYCLFQNDAGGGAIDHGSLTGLGDDDHPQYLTVAEGDAAYQPLDADLTALAGLAANGLIARTGAGTVAARTVTGTANEVSVANGDGVAGNPTVSLPSSLTFTGKTVTGGTYVNPTTKNPNETTQTLTDAANIAWNLDNGGFATVTLGGNRTLDAPTNMKNGGSYVLIVKQDGTGSRTLAFASAYKFPGGTDPVMSTAINAVDILTFVSDGTSMFGVAQKAFA